MKKKNAVLQIQHSDSACTALSDMFLHCALGDVYTMTGKIVEQLELVCVCVDMNGLCVY